MQNNVSMQLSRYSEDFYYHQYHYFSQSVYRDNSPQLVYRNQDIFSVQEDNQAHTISVVEVGSALR